MSELIWGVGVGAFIIYVTFSISYLVNMKRTSATVEKFISHTEGRVNDTLDELKVSLENVRKITSDIRAVTEEVRRLSNTVASLDKGIRGLFGYMKDGFGTTAEANIAGLKAGIKTGVITLVRSMQERKKEGLL